MIRSVFSFIALFLLSIASLHAEQLISVELKAEYQDVVRPAHTQDLAVVFTPQAGWHGYWKQPGDVGFPTQIIWDLPEGVTVSAVQYPVPEAYLTNGIMNYVYNDSYALIAELSTDDTVTAGSELPIKARFDYLVCNESSCIPESASAELVLTTADTLAHTTRTAGFDEYLKALPKPLAATGSYVIDGNELLVTLPLPESTSLDSPRLFIEQSDVIDNVAPQVFARDKDQLVIRAKLSEDYTEQEKLSALVSINKDTGLSFSVTPNTAAGNTSAYSFLSTLLAAILGGLLLNLMPCIFPILSIKIMQFANAANTKEARSESTWYAVGIILSCVALAMVIMLSKEMGTGLGWAFQLQNPYMIFALILLTTAISFNLAGLYEFKSINIPGLRSDNKKTDAFYSGILTALIATPCSGPFMATALGTALVMPTHIGLLIFVGLGIGIALPYLLVSFHPKLSALIPKPGAWMNTLRRTLSVPMFLTVLALLWVLFKESDSATLFYALFSILVLSLGLWLIGIRQSEQKQQKWLFLSIVFGMMLVSSSLFFNTASDTPIQADTVEPYSQERLQHYLADNQPVFLYFTADWCITCHVNEVTALDTTETKQFFANNDVKVLKADWTNGDPAITAALETYNRAGVPLYLWFKPGQSVPEELPQLLLQKHISNLVH